jgi:hypothetical protein
VARIDNGGTKRHGREVATATKAEGNNINK